MQQLRTSLRPDDRARKVARVLVSWHGVSVSELGDIIGCTQQAASNKLLGVRRFRVEELAKLAAYVDADAGLFMRDDIEAVLGTPKDLRSQGDLLCVTDTRPLVKSRAA